MIRVATVADHAAIAKIAKTSKYTSAFTNHMFSSPAHYEKGWVIVECSRFEQSDPRGFICIRNKSRTPETVVYFLGTQPDFRRAGIGEQLLNHVQDQSPSRRVFLKVAVDNDNALGFYLKRGFVVEKIDKEYHHMAWTAADRAPY